MTESRARLPVIEGTLVFEANWAGTLSQKLTTLGCGASMWAIWLSLWLPALTAFFWAAAPIWGVSQARDYWQDALLTLTLILVVGVAMGCFLGAWGALQCFVWQTAERPEPIESISLTDLAQWHKIEETELGQAWACRRLVIHHDGDGQVTRIDASLPRSEDSSTPDVAPLSGADDAELTGKDEDATPPKALGLDEKQRDPKALPVLGGSGSRQHVNVGGVLVWPPPLS